MKKILLLLVIGLILLNGCGTDESKPVTERQEKQPEKQEKETIKTLSGEEVIANLNLIQNSEDSHLIFSSLKDTYHYLSQDYYELVEYIDSVKAGSMDKEGFCSIIKEKSSYTDEILTKMGIKEGLLTKMVIKEGILLYDELKELKGYIIDIARGKSGEFKALNQYCEDDSALSLAKLTGARGKLLIMHSYFIDRKREPKENYDPVWDVTTYSSTKDQKIYWLIQEISQKLKSPQATEIREYGIGDTITKGGHVITFNKVEKDYIHQEYSFKKDCGTWTEEEKTKMGEYEREIGKANKEIREQLIEEYVGKYGNKVNNDCCKFWLFEFGGDPITKEKTIPSIVTIYDVETENLIVYDLEMMRGFGITTFRSNTKIHNYNRFDYSGTNNIFYSVLGRECEEKGLGGMNKIKIVFSWDGCGETKENILGVEKGLIQCDETFVFNTDLSK